MTETNTSSRRRLRRLAFALTLLLTALIAMNFHADIAQADSDYTVAACGPEMEDDLFAFNEQGNGFENNINGTCNSAGTATIGNIFDYSGTFTSGTGAYDVFTAPANETISYMSLDSAGFVVDPVNTSDAGWIAGLYSGPGNTFSSSTDPLGVGSGEDCITSPAPTSNCEHLGEYISQAPALINGSYPETLAFGVTCHNTTCSNSVDAGAQIGSAYLAIDDPNNDPSTSINSDPNSTGGWINGSSSQSVSVSASDPGGVCNLYIQVVDSGGNVVQQSGNLASGQGSYDSSSGNYTSASPCGSTSQAGSWTPNLSALSSGTYYIRGASQNPANASSIGSTAGWYAYTSEDQIRVDNSAPSITVTPSDTQWSSQAQTYSVSASESYSGVNNVVCSGSGVPNGSTSYSGSSTTITETANGDDPVSCLAVNGVGTDSSTASPTGGDIRIDTVTPTMNLDADNSAVTSTTINPAAASWQSTGQTLDVVAHVGDSGTGSTSNPLDNVSGANDLAAATINGGAVAMPYCTVTDNSDPSTNNSYTVSSTSGGEGNPAATAADDGQGNPEWQIPLNTSGDYRIVCTVTNGAGVISQTLGEDIAVDTTTADQLQQEAEHTNTPVVATDLTTSATATSYVSAASQNAAPYSGDPLTIAWTPSDMPYSGIGTNPYGVASPVDTDPIVSSTCTPGGDDQDHASTVTNANTNTVTIGNNGQNTLTCVETDAAGATTADASTDAVYYTNLDQQTPLVSYSQPDGDTGGQDSSNAITPTQSPNALAAADGVSARAFALPVISHLEQPTSTNPVPATGHLAAQPADSTADWAAGPTDVTSTPTEAVQLSGIANLQCSDTNTTTGQSNNFTTTGGSQNLSPTGAPATLGVPASDVAVTGIHDLACQAQDASTFQQSGASTQLHFPALDQDTSYDYTVDDDDATPATVAFGIENQGETVNNPDSYTYDSSTWEQNEATLTATADPVGSNQISSIKSITCGVDDPTFGQVNDPNASDDVTDPVDSADNYTAAIPVRDTNGSGTYLLSCFATSGSLINGTVATTEINLQGNNTPSGTACTGFSNCISGQLNPGSGFSNGPTPGKWYQTEQSITVSASVPAGNAPLESITCNEPPATLDGDNHNPNAEDNGTSITYPNPAGADSLTDTDTIMVGPPGGTLQCYVTDASAQQLSLGATQIDIDDSAPTGYVLPATKSNPGQVSVYVTDNGGSGVASVQIQLVRSGTTTNLTSTSTTTGDGVYTAEIPDDGIDMTSGSYAIQAAVSDIAGNKGTISQLQDGSIAQTSLPVGEATSMIDTIAAGTATPSLTASTVTTTVDVTAKKKVKVGGKTKIETVKVYITKKVKIGNKTKIEKVLKTKTVKTAAKFTPASTTSPVKLAYGASSTAAGMLTTGQNLPVANATVTISETVQGQSTPTTLGTATTNSQGVWVYHIPAGPSRTISFHYTGSGALRDADGSSGAEAVAGKTSISGPKAAKAGKTIVLKGTVAGGYIPAKGVGLRLYYSPKGSTQYSSYNTTYYTNAKGQFAIKVPSSAKARGHAWNFWVQTATQTAWPFTGATSPKLLVTYR